MARLSADNVPSPDAAAIPVDVATESPTEPAAMEFDVPSPMTTFDVSAKPKSESPKSGSFSKKSAPDVVIAVAPAPIASEFPEERIPWSFVLIPF